MGIGFSIARTIIEAHAGRIEAGNNRDGGATFTFHLRASSHMKAHSHSVTDTPVVHIVEDDESCGLATARVMRAAGLAIRLYPSASRFMERCLGGPMHHPRPEPALRERPGVAGVAHRRWKTPCPLSS